MDVKELSQILADARALQKIKNLPYPPFKSQKLPVRIFEKSTIFHLQYLMGRRSIQILGVSLKRLMSQ